MKTASPNPPYCSSCFGAKPEMVHVDFESYWDGPIIDPSSGIKQPIDDLIICEDCLKAAGKLVGLSNQKKSLEELKFLQEEVEELRRFRQEATEKLDSIRMAIV